MKRFKQIISLTLIISLFSVKPVSAQNNQDREIENIANQLVQKISGSAVKNVAIADFANLDGSYSELGKYLAEEFSFALTSIDKNFNVIDRSKVNFLLKEAGLSEGGLVDPNTIAKLGNVKGIDAIVSGSLTPQGNNMRVFVKVLDLETASVIAAVRGDISLNPDIQAMSGSSINSSSKKQRKSVSSIPKPIADSDKSHTIEKDGIEYTFQQCVRKGNKIMVAVLATNIGEKDNGVQVYYPGNGRLLNNNLRIFDVKNTQIIGDPNSIKIAGQRDVEGKEYAKNHPKSDRRVQQTILSGSSAVIEVLFQVDENFGKVLAVEFIFGSGYKSTKIFAHRFKNVEVSYE